MAESRARSWRAPRELRHGDYHTPQEIKVRRDKLDEMLLELDVSETHAWVFRAETIFELACMFELRPEETTGHLRRMSAYCEILCRQIQFSFENCELIRLASQLHDVGNAMIPGELLLKRGKLTPREYETVKDHAEAGHRILAGCTSVIVQIGGLIARSHHERWDGGGYPQGLCDHQIPLFGRIVAIADCFDALTSDRPYRSALPISAAVEVIRDERGLAFDPQLVDQFVKRLPELEAVQHAYPSPP